MASDDDQVLAQEPQQELQPPEPQEEENRAVRIGILVALAVIVLLAILFFLLRGCDTGGTSSNSGASNETSTTSAGASSIPIENKVYAALRGQAFGSNKQTLSNWTYIARANTSGAVTIYLTQTTAELRKSLGRNGPSQITKLVEDTVLARVPEVKTVVVVDSPGASLGTKSR